MYYYDREPEYGYYITRNLKVKRFDLDRATSPIGDDVVAHCTSVEAAKAAARLLSEGAGPFPVGDDGEYW